MNKGYVYVLSNPAMPGIVKIGRSKNGGASRASNLYSGATGVPEPFVLEYEALFEDCVDAEKMVHGWLADCRLSDSREFFKCDVGKAVTELNYLALQDHSDIEADFHNMKNRQASQLISAIHAHGIEFSFYDSLVLFAYAKKLIDGREDFDLFLSTLTGMSAEQVIEMCEARTVQ